MGEIDSDEKNVITIEDPIEYGVDRHQPDAGGSNKKGLTFASGLRSLMRQDPDVMMVGEIRDGETAGIAVQAANTGHLVFSTLHTNDSPGAHRTRMVNLGVEPYLVASAVIARGGAAPRSPDLPPLQRALRPERRPAARSSASLATTGCSRRSAAWKGKWLRHLPRTRPLRSHRDLRDASTIDETSSRRNHFERTSASVIKQNGGASVACKTLRMDGARKVLEGARPRSRKFFASLSSTSSDRVLTPFVGQFCSPSAQRFPCRATNTRR